VKVVFTWFGGKSESSSTCESSSGQTDKHAHSLEHTKIGKRKSIESSQLVTHPIDEILYWHNAVLRELSDIAEETKRIHQSGDFSDIAGFNMRLQFIADVCIFHRYEPSNLKSCESFFL
jgi:zinc finger protein-like protein